MRAAARAARPHTEAAGASASADPADLPATRQARWLPALLALAVLGYALVAARFLASGALGADPAALLWLGSLRADPALLALAPVALSLACSWLLARELHARAAGLRRAEAAARAAARARAVALGSLGHEMRNALSAMAGFSDLLGTAPLPPAQAEHLASLRDCNAHLLALVDGLLEHGRLEAGRIVLHEAAFDVDGTVRACLRPLSLAAARKGVGLAFQGSAGRAVGDATRVRQVLLNLLGNAIKFTAHGMVTVTASAGPEREGRRLLRLEVRDTGIGIQAQDLDRLFQPFSQVGGPPTAGSGLGLAISRQLCRRMGGDLVAESRPGHGSTFTATFRVRAAPPPVATLRAAPGGLRILLAEDNAMNQRLALKVLEGLGHAAAVAADGAQALEMASRRPYDLILMDIHMPVLDGLEATRRLRRSVAPARGPTIIGLTAGALPEDRQRCLEAGMDGHMAKPIDGQRLAALLEAAGLQPAQLAVAGRPPHAP